MNYRDGSYTPFNKIDVAFWLQKTGKKQKVKIMASSKVSQMNHKSVSSSNEWQWN
jgi:hypothetical protein